MKLHPANKWASTLLVVLQKCGKCANENAANEYVNLVVDKHNVDYQVRLNNFNREGVLTHFQQFSQKLTNLTPLNDTIPTVLGGYLGMELFNRWEKEQKDAIVIDTLNECAAEIVNAIETCGMSISLTLPQMREALFLIANSKSISDLGSLNFGNIFGDK
jgi:hypothetical protein